jgi:hypothetical protein
MLNQNIIARKGSGSTRKLSSIFAIILFTMSIVSCTGTSSKVEAIPNVDVPVENINTYIKLSDVPNLMNSHKNREDLTLQIINLSKSSIVFPQNYHAQILMQKDGKYVEIQNNFYNAGEQFILPTKDAYPLGLLVSYLPIAPITEPTTVRVSIDGYLQENQQVRVGAYLDVQLKP